MSASNKKMGVQLKNVLDIPIACNASSFSSNGTGGLSGLTCVLCVPVPPPSRKPLLKPADNRCHEKRMSRSVHCFFSLQLCKCAFVSFTCIAKHLFRLLALLNLVNFCCGNAGRCIACQQPCASAGAYHKVTASRRLLCSFCC